MGKKEKLIERLKSYTKDFTFNELQNVLESLGFELLSKGKTSGSRVRFLKANIVIILHKPHRRKELLEYQIKQVLDILEREDLI